MAIVVSSSVDTAQLASGIRSAVASIDPSEAVSQFQDMQRIVSESAAGDRFNTILLGLLSWTSSAHWH